MGILRARRPLPVPTTGWAAGLEGVLRLEVQPLAPASRGPAWPEGTPAAGPWVEGESIAVQGVCLTLVRPPAPGAPMEFDVVPETLDKTTLGSRAIGSRVHLERAARASTLMGGHVVQGHVDGVGRVESIDTASGWRARLSVPPHLAAYLVPKGSIAVDGVSLTLAEVLPAQSAFEIALIPTTLAKTTLGALTAGDRVHIECDPMAKTIVHYLRHFAPPSGGWPAGQG
jgi:riboflavin synthase